MAAREAQGGAAQPAPEQERQRQRQPRSGAARGDGAAQPVDDGGETLIRGARGGWEHERDRNMGGWARGVRPRGAFQRLRFSLIFGFGWGAAYPVTADLWGKANTFRSAASAESGAAALKYPPGASGGSFVQSVDGG